MDATTVIAAIVAIIALMNWHTANQKVKVDLLEKRTQFYNEMLDMLDNAFIDDEIKDSSKFFRLRRTSRVLFSENVYKSIDEISDLIFDIHQKKNSREGMSIEDKNASYESFVKIKKLFRKQYDDLENLMLSEMRPEILSARTVIRKYKDRHILRFD